jgi:hypothetical protein
MTSPTPDHARTSEIACLLAWARSLSEAGPAADPVERVAYQTAKTALLARITQHTDLTPIPDSTRDRP